ncbi:MAG: hypothetical protein II060_01150, partial [Bacteroidales bacterium]|nr:hypothetical protein [Bacteroidales bacterium]
GTYGVGGGGGGFYGGGGSSHKSNGGELSASSGAGGSGYIGNNSLINGIIIPTWLVCLTALGFKFQKQTQAFLICRMFRQQLRLEMLDITIAEFFMTRTTLFYAKIQKRYTLM